MALLFPHSILVKHTITVWLLWLLASTGLLAQHPGTRTPAVPPVVHAPVYRAPIYQPPIYNGPGYSQPQALHAWPTPFANAPNTLIPRPPIPPIHPLPPRFRFYVFPVPIAPLWPSSFCWWATCDRYFWTAPLLDTSIPQGNWNPWNSIPAPAVEPPQYDVFGAERPDLPQLFLKDETVLFVNDYWVVDDDLHFTIIEDERGVPAEHVVPFEQLNLQKTIDVNTQRGFRFMLRNEPFEQYVRDHPGGPPPALLSH